MKKKVARILCLIILLGSVVCVGGSRIYDERLLFAEQVAAKFFKYGDEKMKKPFIQSISKVLTEKVIIY